MRSKILKFLRFTTQGVAIASFGTLGVNPSWGGFVLGLLTFFIAFGIIPFEGD